MRGTPERSGRCRGPYLGVVLHPKAHATEDCPRNYIKTLAGAWRRVNLFPWPPSAARVARSGQRGEVCLQGAVEADGVIREQGVADTVQDDHAGIGAGQLTGSRSAVD
jgi:hypothetical protein